MNRSFFEQIAHLLIFGHKTSDSLGNQMSEFPALEKIKTPLSCCLQLKKLLLRVLFLFIIVNYQETSTYNFRTTGNNKLKLYKLKATKN